MSKPNKVFAYVPKGASDYWVFTARPDAMRCETHFREAGYTNVRVTTFRVGPRNENQRAYRVSVYYDPATQARPTYDRWA